MLYIVSINLYTGRLKTRIFMEKEYSFQKVWSNTRLKSEHSQRFYSFHILFNMIPH